MTLEELLDSSAAQLKALSDQQLLDFFKAQLPVTRPELAPRPKNQSESLSPEALKRKLVLEKLKAAGLDVDLFSKKQQKR